jgi:hypothetical protein
MLTKKELFKKRWLYVLGWVFFWVIPALMIGEKTFAIENKGKSVSISLAGFIIGLAFLGLFAKRFREWMKKKDIGFISVLILRITDIIPFAVIACMIYLAMNALTGFDTTAWLVCLSMVFGSFMMAIECEINKQLIYELELYKEAKREVDKDNMKERYKQKLAEMKGDI